MASSEGKKDKRNDEHTVEVIKHILRENEFYDRFRSRFYLQCTESRSVPLDLP